MSSSPPADDSDFVGRPPRWRLPPMALMALTSMGTLLIVAVLLQLSQTLHFAQVGRKLHKERIQYSRVEKFLSEPVPIYPGATLIKGPGRLTSKRRASQGNSALASPTLRWETMLILDASDLTVQQIEQLCPFYINYLKSSDLGLQPGRYSYRSESAYDTLQGHPIDTAYGFRQFASARGSSLYGLMEVEMEVREATGSPMTRDEFVRMASEFGEAWTTFDKYPKIPRRVAVVKMCLFHTNMSAE